MNHGVYFNIISPSLEQFYFDKSSSINGHKNMMEGLVLQEFRKVVVTGSIQNQLDNIAEVMAIM